MQVKNTPPAHDDHLCCLLRLPATGRRDAHDFTRTSLMSAIVDLFGQSIAKDGQPVPCPDFTRGKWQRTRPKFALDAAFAMR